MPEVRLIPLGVGDAFTARHYTTCLALGVDDSWLLIDCPHPVRKMWREASLSALGEPLDLDRVVGVAITHLHADHASGLEDFAYFTHFGLKRRATWLAHPEVSARLWDGLLSAGMGRMRTHARRRHDPEAARRLRRPDPARRVEARRVRPVLDRVPPDDPLDPDHRLPDQGRRPDLRLQRRYRLRPGPDRLAQPRRPDRPRGDHPRPSPPVHTPYARLAALPEALRAKMRLSHLPDDFDAASSLIEPLLQGRCYRV